MTRFDSSSFRKMAFKFVDPSVRSALRQAADDADILAQLIDAAKDINDWLCRINLAGTAHQIYLADVIEGCQADTPRTPKEQTK